MEIKVADLLKGDEILILGQASKYVKILEDIKEKGPAKYHHTPGYILQHNVRCHINVQVLTVMRSRWDYKTKTYIPTPQQLKTYVLETPKEGEGIIKKLDLNYHRLWLVKREI